jgi:GAF domain-containing protein
MSQPHQLRRLVELSVILNSTLDLDALLQLITATATELVECEAASILLYDEKDQRLFFAANGRPGTTGNKSPFPSRTVWQDHLPHEPPHYPEQRRTGPAPLFLVSDHIN